MAIKSKIKTFKQWSSNTSTPARNAFICARKNFTTKIEEAKPVPDQKIRHEPL